jgi:hypothetical protein
VHELLVRQDDTGKIDKREEDILDLILGSTIALLQGIVVSPIN